MNNKQKELHSITINLDKFATLLEDRLIETYIFTLPKLSVNIKVDNNHIIINLNRNEINYLIALFRMLLNVEVKFKKYIMNDKFCFDLDLTKYLNDINIRKRINTFINLLDKTNNFHKYETIIEEFSEKYKLLHKYICAYINKNYEYIPSWTNPPHNAICYNDYRFDKAAILAHWFETACLFVNAQQNGVPVYISIQQNRRKIYTDIIKLLDLDYSYLDNINYRTTKFKFRIPYNKLDVIIGLLKLSI